MTRTAACTALILPSITCRSFIISSFMFALRGDGCVGTPIVSHGWAGTRTHAPLPKRLPRLANSRLAASHWLQSMAR